MKHSLTLLCALLLAAGCSDVQMQKLFPPNPQKVDWWDRSLGERDGLRGYRVQVEVSDPGSRIEVDGEHVLTITNTTGEIILWADANGTFRNNHTTVITANPVGTNQFVQRKVFSSVIQRTYVPHAIYFNLNLQPVRPLERIDVKVDRTNRELKE